MNLPPTREQIEQGDVNDAASILEAADRGDYHLPPDLRDLCEEKEREWADDEEAQWQDLGAQIVADRPASTAELMQMMARSFKLEARPPRWRPGGKVLAPRRTRGPRRRGAGRPAGRRCGASSSTSSSDPGDPDGEHEVARLRALVERQDAVNRELGEALDEAIAALAELSAELDAERGDS